MRAPQCCRTCLATDVRLCDLNQYSLSKSYAVLVGHACDEDDGMPCTVCYECASRLDKFRIFRKRSRRAHVVLRGLLEEHDELTVTSLRKVDRTQPGLESSLVCCNLKPIIIEPTIENSSDFEFKLDHVESISNECEFSESEAEIKPVDFEVKREACSPEPSVDNLDYYVSFLPGPKQEDHIPEPEKNTRKQKKRLPKRDNAASEKGKVKNVEKAAPKRKRITRNGPNESSGTADDPKTVKRVRKVKNENGEEITPRKKRTKISSTLKSDGTNAEVTIKPKRSRARPGARQHTLYSAEYYNNFATVTVMSEEEQMEFFRQRQDTERYKMATYKCTDCFLPFACQEAYHTHRKRHDDPSEGQEVCNICKVRLKDVPLLKKHIAMNHRTKFECRKCTHVCASSMSARVHESTHADKTYPCTECGLEFKRLMSYNQHVYKTHPSYVACPVCGDTFLGQGAVNKHRAKTHSGVADADCKVMCECRVLFYSDEAYSAHRQSYPQHTDGKNGLISCEFCEEKFPNLEAAQEHRKTHKQAYIDATGGVECEQCGKVLSTNREYSRHFRWSHPDKTRTKYPLNRSAHYVMCELCGRVCQSFAMYRDHIKIYHQGEKPYKCDVCHKGFITSYARKEHRRVHTKEQPYQCTVCNRAFTSYSNLQRHKSVHTDETPFSCEVCGKCFKFRYTVKYHIQYVHLKKPWPKRDRSKRTQKRTEAERELAALME